MSAKPLDFTILSRVIQRKFDRGNLIEDYRERLGACEIDLLDPDLSLESNFALL